MSNSVPAFYECITFSPCLTYLVWQTRYIIEVIWKSEKYFEPSWVTLQSCIQAERSKQIFVWRPLYKLFYFVCECMKDTHLVCFSLLDDLCTSDRWNQLPWTHLTGSRDKFVSFILSGLIWGLWSLLPCSCYVMWIQLHTVQWLQLISFLFGVDGLSGRTKLFLHQLWRITPSLLPFEFFRPYFHIALLPQGGNVASAPFCLLSEPKSFRVLVWRVAWGPSTLLNGSLSL